MPTTTSRSSISADGASQVLEAALAKANELGLAMSIAVVDESAQLKAFVRMDGAIFPSVGVSQDKAYTSAGFGLPTVQWYDVIKDDPPLLHGITSIPRFMLLGGGHPLIVDGAVVGAIGVSGGSYQQDAEVAEAGAKALA